MEQGPADWRVPDQGWRNRAGRQMERASVLIETASCGRFPPLERIFIYCCQAGMCPASSSRTVVTGRPFLLLSRGWLGQTDMGNRRTAPLTLATSCGTGSVDQRTHSWGKPIPGKDGSTIYAVGETRVGAVMRFDQYTGLFAPFWARSADFVSFSRDGESVAYVSFPDGIVAGEQSRQQPLATHISTPFSNHCALVSGREANHLC